MAELKTKTTKESVAKFLAAIPDEGRRADAQEVCRMMEEATGEKPAMWGPSIIGFGKRHLKYATGRELDWFEIGFSPRKANLVVYLMDGFEKHQALLARLGASKTSVGCLYLKRLEKIDRGALRELIEASVVAMRM